MSGQGVILYTENMVETADTSKAVFYRPPKQRAYKIRTKTGNLTAGYKRLVKAGRAPVPVEFRVVDRSGRIVRRPKDDNIAIRRITAEIAKSQGFDSKTQLIAFLAKAVKRGRPITTYSGLQKRRVEQKAFLAIDRSAVARSSDRKRQLQQDLSNIKVIKRRYMKNLKLRSNVIRLDLNRDVGMDDLPDIRNILEYIVSYTIRTENLNDNDRVQLRIDSPTYHKGGDQTAYAFVKDYASLVPSAMDRIQKTVQSAESLKNVSISVNSIDVASGRGRSSKIIKMMDRKGVFTVNTASHCGFIALAMCKPIAKLLQLSSKIYERNTARDRLRFKAGLEVMSRCGIPQEQEVADFSDFRNIADTFGLCIHIYDIHSKQWLRTPNQLTVPNDDDHHVYLLKSPNHYDAIYQPKAWFEQDYICHACEHGYKTQHKCKVSERNHKTPRVINKSKRCMFCKIEKNAETYHRCCPNCLEDSTHEHECFMTRGKVVARLPGKEAPSHSTLLRTEDDGREIYEVANLRSSENYIFFDIECQTLEDNSHLVNLVVAEYFNGRRHVFETLPEFMEWLFQMEDGAFIHDGYTVIAHYGSGYDFKFLYEYMLKNTTMTPFTIFSGEKITYMSLDKKINMRFVDSFKFFLAGLEKLPKMFQLKELKKGFFPHAFNTPANQSYVGAYPDKSYYGCNDFKEDKRADFLKWWLMNKQMGAVFDFQKELLAYCISDVDILRRSCIALREFFMTSCQLDPFQYTTLPACTLALYRAHDMPHKSIAIFDTGKDNQSRVGLEWLAYREVADRHKIHTARDGREAWIRVKRGNEVKPIKIDGLYCKEVYEFSGCFHHGCPTCYPARKDRFEALQQRNRDIQEAGYTLHHIWGCDWDRLRKEEDVQHVLESITACLPIEPRDAFFGGRTDALKTYFNTSKAPKKCKIFYKDITSLYPWVNFNCEYPVGHPQIIRADFDKSLKSYFGIVKCLIQPPDNLYHPVLPRKVNGKLVFDLGGADNKAFVGTWTTMEVIKAIEMGYTIKTIYEVHHFEKRSSSIFKPYVARFLKIKQEASGYPSWVKTDADKDEYIRLYHEHEGILLEKDKIQKNEGLRSFAKLCLNNLWGRFGMRSFDDERKIVRTHNDVLDVLTNPKLVADSLNFHLFDDIDEAIATYCVNDNDRSTIYTTNIYIALFTTSWARLQLYKALETLGERVLYMDTDSVVYYHEDDSGHGLDQGDYLGQWTDEMDDHWAEVWVSGGPKNYGYRIAKKPGCPDNCKTCGKTVCKVKGFSLNYANSQSINTDTMIYAVRKACVNDYSGPSPDMKVSNFRIRYDKKTRQMYSKTEPKQWSYTVEKRAQRLALPWIIDTTPHGFSDV